MLPAEIFFQGTNLSLLNEKEVPARPFMDSGIGCLYNCCISASRSSYFGNLLVYPVVRVIKVNQNGKSSSIVTSHFVASFLNFFSPYLVPAISRALLPLL